LTKIINNDRCSVGKLYRSKNRRRPYKKRWFRKKAKDKKGFTRYSTGPKWSGQYFPEKPAFWRKWQRQNWREPSPDEILSNGFTKTQAWIALCKSFNGFLFAKREDHHEDMKQYAMQIRSIQKVLNLPQSYFEIFTPGEMEWIDRESDVEAKEKWYASCV
jgi:hypothetical protein